MAKKTIKPKKTITKKATTKKIKSLKEMMVIKPTKNSIISQEDIKRRNEIITNLVLTGDISKMNDIQRVEYYNQLCISLDLNPLTKPFDIILFPKNNKVSLYPNKYCAEQLRKKDGVSIYKTERIIEDNILIFKAYAKNKFGILDEATSSIPLVKIEKKWDSTERDYKPTGNYIPMNPQEKADAIMKCETKAKRRVTFSICGLGMADDPEEAERYEDVIVGNKEDEILKVVSDNINKLDEAIKDITPKWDMKQAKDKILSLMKPVRKKLTKEEESYITNILINNNYTENQYKTDIQFIDEIIKRIEKEEN